MRATVVLLVGLVAVAMSGALDGCGGQLTGKDAAADADPVGNFGQPLCVDTVSKGGACTPTDQPFCYKTCGPAKQGVKSETCAGGTYAEMAGCTFDPSRDYSCYKIPVAANSACPVGIVPRAAQSCAVPTCTICNSLRGVSEGQYLDEDAATKIGYCVCLPSDANGVRLWSCASDATWPCPIGAGC